MTVAIQTPRIQMILADDGTAIDLDALQGLWTDEQYLRLTSQTNRLIELTDGILEVLPMPSRKPQAISQLLFLALLAVLGPRGGKVFYSPLWMWLRTGKYREPDLLALLDAQGPRNQHPAWLGADLVVEIVSPDDPTRDTVV